MGLGLWALGWVGVSATAWIWGRTAGSGSDWGRTAGLVWGLVSSSRISAMELFFSWISVWGARVPSSGWVVNSWTSSESSSSCCCLGRFRLAICRP